MSQLLRFPDLVSDEAGSEEWLYVARNTRRPFLPGSFLNLGAIRLISFTSASLPNIFKESFSRVGR